MRYTLIALALIIIPVTAIAKGNRYNRPWNKPTPIVIQPTTQPTDNEVRMNVYVTSYASGDNDPAGSTVTYNSGIEGNAGGTGTYNDPITLAVGYVGQKSDYPYGTKFYIPGLLAYFQVKDTCASCHKGNNGKVWIDVYAGDYKGSGVLNCENRMTGNYDVIQNPNPDYTVISGSLYANGICRK